MYSLSVIVPIYNVQTYLSKCIDSLLVQGMPPEDYEIVLVDDGSTDESGTIADEYAAEHTNIRVIHQPNAGLSEARNTGMKVAQGEYIMFVDSDDYLEPDVLHALVAKMRRDNLDVLRFNYQNVNEQGEVFEPNKISKPFVDYRDEVCDGCTFLNERLGNACYVVQFLLKRELALPFTSGIYFEDVDWTPRMLLQAKRVTSVDTMVYNYLMRFGSITRTADLNKKRKSLNDHILIISNHQKLAQTVSDRRWFDGMTAATVIGLLSTVAAYFYPERHAWLARIRSLGVFPLSSFHLTPLARRKVVLANLSPSLFCAVMHFLRK